MIDATMRSTKKKVESKKSPSLIFPRKLQGLSIIERGDGVAIERLHRFHVSRDVLTPQFARNTDGLPERGHLKFM